MHIILCGSLVSQSESQILMATLGALSHLVLPPLPSTSPLSFLHSCSAFSLLAARARSLPTRVTLHRLCSPPEMFIRQIPPWIPLSPPSGLCSDVTSSGSSPCRAHLTPYPIFMFSVLPSAQAGVIVAVMSLTRSWRFCVFHSLVNL